MSVQHTAFANLPTAVPPPRRVSRRRLLKLGAALLVTSTLVGLVLHGVEKLRDASDRAH
jgi:hypothetical protein